MIKPVYERLSDQYTDVVFVEVLQDKLQEVVLAESECWNENTTLMYLTLLLQM